MKRIPISSTQGLPLVQIMLIEELSKKVDSVLEILQRIEARQIGKTTEAVMEVKEHEPPPVGSFAARDK